MRQLIHFFRLDWRYEAKFKRSSSNSLRASYSNSKMEKLSGADNLYTFSLKACFINRFEEKSGLSNDETYPALSIIFDEATDIEKPIHEMPSIALIRDEHKEKIRHHAITQGVRRAHNLNALSKSVFQPHELYALWKEITRTKGDKIRGIDKQSVRQMIVLSCFSINPFLIVIALKYIETPDEDFGFSNKMAIGFIKLLIKPRQKWMSIVLILHFYLPKIYWFIYIPPFIESLLSLDADKKMAYIFWQRQKRR